MHRKPIHPLAHLASIFAKVRPGEGVAVAILLVDLFVILTAYYLLKVVREPLILLGGGAAVKTYAAAGQAVLLVALVPAYGWFSSRVRRMVLINVVTAIFAGSFVVFCLLYGAGVSIGVGFYLWLGIFNMMVIAQFWSLANELFSTEQGTRLFAIIAFGGTIGAIAGARIAKELIEPLGIANLMLLAAALLAGCIGLTILGARAARHARTPEVAAAAAAAATGAAGAQDHPLAKGGGFKLVMSVRYLRLIAMMIVVYNLVNTTGEYILGSVVTERATAAAGGNHELAKQLIGEFYGNYFTWVNALAAILQAVVVSRVVKYVGVRVALLLVPTFALGSYGLIAAVPILLWIKVAKITENSIDYSLHNTARQMLWLPTSAEAKYKAKAAIDTFFVRCGDVLAAGVVWGGSQLALPPRMFAVVNIVAAALWLGLAFAVGHEHRRQVEGQRAAS